MLTNESTVEHKIISHFESLLEYKLPIRSFNNHLNLSSKDQCSYELYLLIYLVTQYLACLLLFLLNNWHYVTLYKNSKETKFKRTQSVIDFMKKNDYETNKLVYLKTHMNLQNCKQTEAISELKSKSATSVANEIELIETSNLNPAPIEKSNSYLYVPYFKNSKLSNSFSDLSVNI